MLKRKLSADERLRIAEERRNKEVCAHPNKMISVRVEEQTDDSGKPVVWVHFIGERQSMDWKSCDNA